MHKRLKNDKTLAQLGPIGNYVVCDPEIMGGVPTFKGTRVPVQCIMDFLCSGMNLDEISVHYPGVEQTSIIAVLRLVPRLLAAPIQKAYESEGNEIG